MLFPELSGDVYGHSKGYIYTLLSAAVTVGIVFACTGTGGLTTFSDEDDDPPPGETDGDLYDLDDSDVDRGGTDGDLDRGTDGDESVDGDVVDIDITVDGDRVPDGDIPVDGDVEEDGDVAVDGDAELDLDGDEDSVEAEPEQEKEGPFPIACDSAVGCPDDLGCVDGFCGECVGHGHCEPGLCTPLGCSGCNNDGECQDAYGEDINCEFGECVNKSCRQDADCRLFEDICLDHRCGPCRNNYDCQYSDAYGSGYQCLAGNCSEGNCESDFQCPEDAPICGNDQRCRACQPNNFGRDGECIARFGAGYLCNEGICVKGECLTSTECLVVNQGLCVTEVDEPDGDEDDEEEEVPLYICRSCLDPEEDEACRTEYGQAGLLCIEGECMPADCHNQADCYGSGRVCRENQCVVCSLETNPDSACVDAFGEGYLCEQDTCIPGDCHDQSDCIADAEICANHSCTACSGDTADADCRAAYSDGYICESGQCIEGDCHSLGDCSGQGQLCISNHCNSCSVQDDPDGSCVTAYGIDYLCDSGECVAGNCHDQSDCNAGGTICENNTCRTCAGNEADADCQAAYSANYICEEEACIIGDCHEQADCEAQSQICLTHKCVTCSSQPYPDEVCQSAYGDDYICLGDVCIAGDCRQQTDCQGADATKVCHDNYCTPCDTIGDDPDAHDQSCKSGFTDIHICQEGFCLQGCEAGTMDVSGAICGEDNRWGNCVSDPECVAASGDYSKICDEILYLCVDGCSPPAMNASGQVCGLDHRFHDCTEDRQCVLASGNPNELCDEGRCTNIGGCTPGTACPDGQVCRDDHRCYDCDAPEERDTGDGACEQAFGDGFLCIDHICTQADCRDHVDCQPDGKLCNEINQCVNCDISEDCQTVDIYGEDYICDGGVCVVGSCSTDGECSALDGNCLKGVCSGNQCTQVQAGDDTDCQDNDPCTHTDQCDSGDCQGTLYSCDDELDCTDDICHGNGDCSQNVLNGFCLIGGACYSHEQVRHADPPAGEANCHACDTTVSQDSWTEQVCGDGLACTDDSCPSDGLCDHELVSTGCFIDGVCYNNQEDNPNNDCEWCQPAGTGGQELWSPKSSYATCAETPPLTCTVDHCDGVGACQHDMMGSACLIGGVCYLHGTNKPGNPCLYCDTTVTQYDWSPRIAGSPCTADEYECTNDVCDAVGACRHELEPGYCRIGGACYTAESENPQNECEYCFPAVDTEDWSPRSSSTPCTVDAFSCTTDRCNGSGGCIHPLDADKCMIEDRCWDSWQNPAANTCVECNPALSQGEWSDKDYAVQCESDGYDCTKDICDGEGTCAHDEIVLGSCFIDDVCRNSGDAHLLNDCLVCNPGLNQTNWSPQSAGTDCDDPDGCRDFRCDAQGSCELYEVHDGFCYIEEGGEGSCYNNGQKNGDCQVCNHAANSLAWTNLSGNTCDPGSGALHCVDYECVQGSCDWVSVNPSYCYIEEGDEGQCYSSGHIEDQCKICTPLISRTSWTTRTGVDCYGGAGSPSCLHYTCRDDFSCYADPLEDVIVGKCYIEGICRNSDETNPQNQCQNCIPGESQIVWSNLNGVSCSGDVGCLVYQCVHGDCDDVDINSSYCYISGNCYTNGTANGQCQICEHAYDDNWWKPLTGNSCSVAGGDNCADYSCHSNGQCLFDQINNNYCLINDVCYEAGADYTDCKECHPSTSQTAWTRKPDWCAIGDDTSWECAYDGTSKAGTHYCSYCDTAANPTAWSTQTDYTLCDDGDPSRYETYCVGGNCGYRYFRWTATHDYYPSITFPVIVDLFNNLVYAIRDCNDKYSYFPDPGGTCNTKFGSSWRMPTVAELHRIRIYAGHTEQSCNATGQIRLDPIWADLIVGDGYYWVSDGGCPVNTQKAYAFWDYNPPFYWACAENMGGPTSQRVICVKTAVTK